MIFQTKVWQHIWIVVQKRGWSTPDVYKNVYQETFDSERVKADTIIDTYFNNIIKKDKGTHE